MRTITVNNKVNGLLIEAAGHRFLLFLRGPLNCIRYWTICMLFLLSIDYNLMWVVF